MPFADEQKLASQDFYGMLNSGFLFIQSKFFCLLSQISACAELRLSFTTHLIKQLLSLYVKKLRNNYKVRMGVA